MKRTVLLILVLVVSSTGAFGQMVFKAPLEAPESHGRTLTFGQDSYSIDGRDRYLLEDWHPGDPCKITEEGRRPESYARIYNERTRNWVRGFRIKNEEDKKKEIEKATRRQQQAQQQAEQRKAQEQASLAKKLAKRQQQYAAILNRQIMFQQMRLKTAMAQLQKYTQLVQLPARPLQKVRYVARITKLRSVIAGTESQIERLEKDAARLQSQQHSY
jgi:hypothetical protein